MYATINICIYLIKFKKTHRITPNSKRPVRPDVTMQPEEPPEVVKVSHSKEKHSATTTTRRQQGNSLTSSFSGEKFCFVFIKLLFL